MITFLSSFSPITKKLVAQYLQTSQIFNYNPLNHFPKSPTISSQIFLRKTIDYFVRPRFHKITKTLGTNSVQTSELATLPNLHFTDTQTSVQASPTQVSSTFWRAKPMSRVYDSSRKNEKRLHLYLGTCEPREDLPVPWTEAIHLPFSKCALQDNRTKKKKKTRFCQPGMSQSSPIISATAICKWDFGQELFDYTGVTADWRRLWWVLIENPRTSWEPRKRKRLYEPVPGVSGVSGPSPEAFLTLHATRFGMGKERSTRHVFTPERPARCVLSF